MRRLRSLMKLDLFKFHLYENMPEFCSALLN